MSFPWIEKSKSIDMLINMKSNPKNIHYSIYEEVEKKTFDLKSAFNEGGALKIQSLIPFSLSLSLIPLSLSLSLIPLSISLFLLPLSISTYVCLSCLSLYFFPNTSLYITVPHTFFLSLSLIPLLYLYP